MPGDGPLSCAVAVAFLKQVDALLPHICEISQYFQSGLEQLARKHSSIREVRGSGLMLALELESADLAKEVARKVLERGVIINRTHETVLRFLPPYIIEKKHVEAVVAALDWALRGSRADAVPKTVRRPLTKARSKA